MASVLRWVGFTQIGVVRGTVAKTGVGDAEGELQLWYKEGSNEYCIKASKTAKGARGVVVCKVIDVLLRFTSKSALTKSKRY